MTNHALQEVWLRGAVGGIPPPLQPVAHALMQVMEDVERVCSSLTPEQLWMRPGEVASIGFHLKHIAGSTDRLFTYGRGEALSESQRVILRQEKEAGVPHGNATALIEELRHSIDAALSQLRHTPPEVLYEHRNVGRANLPSTVAGLLFHAAEHASRHAGQIITTAKLVAG